VVGELLGEWRSADSILRARPSTFWMAGKALTAAVKKYAGESAAIQRCQSTAAECGGTADRGAKIRGGEQAERRYALEDIPPPNKH